MNHKEAVLIPTIYNGVWFISIWDWGLLLKPLRTILRVTVHQAVEQFLITGDLSGLKRKLTDKLKYFIIYVVLDNPGIMLH